MIGSLKAVGLSRRYGLSYAIRDADFELKSGTITALIGANGAGKSTAFNLLSGRIKPTKGDILFDDQPATGGPERRRQCGYLSHASFLYGALTGRENLALVAQLHRVDPGRVDEVLEHIGVKARANAPVRTYSRGMEQRLALGRLLLIQPHVWLLDEPASGLDEAGRKWLMQQLKDLANEGRIIAFSSHHRELVAELATHVVVLAKARMKHAGVAESPEHIRSLFAEHIG